ncbi:hypothetical protein ABPG77_001957 [Micractinium sp. CCAP 211/92]
MQQEQPPAAPSPTEGQQQAQAAMAAAVSAAGSAPRSSAQQAAALAAMLPPAGTPGSTPGSRPPLALHPALAAMNQAGLGMLPLGASPAAFAALSVPRPGMPGQPFFFPTIPQHMAAATAAAQQLAGGSAAAGSAASSAAAAAGGSARRPSSRPSGRSSSASKKSCNCKNSRCLKLYCECFASGRYCDGCNCLNCNNNREHESTRQAAVEAILERNPNAFRPKIAGAADSRSSGGARHNKGCNCKKSGCLKKYCECFQAGITCSDNCKCLDCKNYEGSEAREALISPQSDRQQSDSPLGLRRSMPPRSGMPALPPGALPPMPLPQGALQGTPGSFPSPGTQAAALAAQLQQAQQQGAQGQQQQPQQQPPKQLSEEERREVARAAMAEVIRPEVVEKLAMLLMVVSQEEQDRRLQGQPANEQPQQQGEAGTEQSPAATGQELQPEPQEQQAQQQQADEPAAMEVDSPQPQGVKLEPSVAAAAEPTAAGPNGLAQPPAAAETAGAAEGAEASPAAPGEGGSLYQAQERLVLTEFRDALQMISRVIGEKVDKKAAAAQQAQQLLLPPLPPPAGGTPGAGAAPGGLPAAMLGALGLPQLKPAGQPGGMLMAAAGTPGQQPQLVLLPPTLLPQQLAASGQQVALMQTSQGLQAFVKAASQQQQQPQQQPVPQLVPAAAPAAAEAESEAPAAGAASARASQPASES